MTQQQRFDFIPASFTPFTEAGAIDLASIELYARYLSREGLQSVFINGTTGEGLSLTTDERIQLAEAWLQHGSRLKVIVHVGENCVRQAEKLARHAQDCGAAAISAMAPSFFLPNNLSELLDFLVPIAAAAPATDFYYYHLPSMTGMYFDMEAFIPLAAERIPTFAGVKYTHEDLNEYQRCESRWRGKYRMHFGRDELLLPALSYHARSGVGSIYNLLPRCFQAIADSFFSGQLERALDFSSEVNRFIETVKQVGVIPAGKVLFSQLGIGSCQARLPNRTLSDAERGLVLQAARRVPLDGEKWQSSKGISSPHIDLSASPSRKLNRIS